VRRPELDAALLERHEVRAGRGRDRIGLTRSVGRAGTRRGCAAEPRDDRPGFRGIRLDDRRRRASEAPSARSARRRPSR
jgi:hypothetical protein